MTYKYESDTSYQGNALCEFFAITSRLEKLYNAKILLKNMYKESHFFKGDKWIFEYELESEK